MILQYYKKKTPSQESLIRTLSTDLIGEKGTTHGAMLRHLRKSGFTARSKRHTSLKDISKALTNGDPTLVHYTEPSENDDHYALVIEVSATAVVLNDPWNGKNFTVPKSEFMRRWRDTAGKFPRWALFMRP